MSGVDFFSKLSEMMAEQGALLPGDGPMLRTLAGMGVGPLATVSVDTLRLSVKAQMQVSPFALVHSAAQSCSASCCCTDDASPRTKFWVSIMHCWGLGPGGASQTAETHPKPYVSCHNAFLSH